MITRQFLEMFCFDLMQYKIYTINILYLLGALVVLWHLRRPNLGVLE